MPQDELKDTGRVDQKRLKSFSLSQRDLCDLELVRRRVQDNMLEPAGQTTGWVIMEPYLAGFIVSTMHRIVGKAREHGCFTWNTAGAAERSGSRSPAQVHLGTPDGEPDRCG